MTSLDPPEEDGGTPVLPTRAARGSPPPPATRPLRGWDRPRLRLLVYLMFVYGVALIVVSLAVGLEGSTPTSSATPVPCSLASLPPATNTVNASVQATTLSFPPPANGSEAPEGIEVWVNASDQVLPGTEIGVSVRPIGGLPAGSSCTLPIPALDWSSSPATALVTGETHTTLNVTGAPPGPYARSGAFAVIVTVNETNVVGSFGSTHALLWVG